MGKYPAISNTNTSIIQHYLKIAKNLGYFKSLYKRRKRKENWKAEYVIVLNQKARKTFKTIKSILIPILQQKKFAVEYLKGIIDSEGSIYIRSKKIEVKISNTDKSIINATVTALKTLGIKHTITADIRRKRKKKICYYIRTYGKTALKLLKTCKPVKFINKKL